MITGAHGGSERIGIAEPLRFPRLVLAFHVYGTPPPGVYGCPERICLNSECTAIRAVLRERSRTRTDQPGGPAMIMDEFGGGPSIPDIGQVADLARGRRSPGATGPPWTRSPHPAPPERVCWTSARAGPWPGKAKILAFPYPLATAGTPGPQTWDATTRRFHFSFTVDPHVHAPTEIIVPPYDYPDGYRVITRGALGPSTSDSSLLELSTLPGSSQVSVTVLPAAKLGSS